jgi:hydroxymethylbilane synthase
VQTRLRKFEEDKHLDAVIFAKAGLERLNLLTENSITLDWMLPAPAQGIIGIVCRDGDTEMKEICSKINHRESFIAGFVEREFLKTLMGGCSVPISALVKIKGNEIEFQGAMHSYDGSRCFEIRRVMPFTNWENAGKELAEKLLQQNGAPELIEEIRNKK